MKYKVRALFGFTNKEDMKAVKKGEELVLSKERYEELLSARAIELLEEIKPKKVAKKKKNRHFASFLFAWYNFRRKDMI